MNTTYQVLSGTEAQSDPDSSTVPVVCGGFIFRQNVGATVDKQSDSSRFYTARSGDAHRLAGSSTDAVARWGNPGLRRAGLHPVSMMLYDRR